MIWPANVLFTFRAVVIIDKYLSLKCFVGSRGQKCLEAARRHNTKAVALAKRNRTTEWVYSSSVSSAEAGDEDQSWAEQAAVTSDATGDESVSSAEQAGITSAATVNEIISSAKSCAVPSVEAGDEDQLLAEQAAVTSDATGDEGVSLVEQAAITSAAAGDEIVSSAKSCAVSSVEAGGEDQTWAEQAAVTSDATGNEGVSLAEPAAITSAATGDEIISSVKLCAVPSVEACDEDQLLAEQAAVTSDATGDEVVSSATSCAVWLVEAGDEDQSWAEQAAVTSDATGDEGVSTAKSCAVSSAEAGDEGVSSAEQAAITSAATGDEIVSSISDSSSVYSDDDVADDSLHDPDFSTGQQSGPSESDSYVTNSDDCPSDWAMKRLKSMSSVKLPDKLLDVEGETSQPIPYMHIGSKREKVKPADIVFGDNDSEDEASHSVPVIDISSQRGESENSQKHSDRPARPCPYCGKFRVRLTRHIKAVHKKEAGVEHGLKGGAHEQRDMFKLLKRSGIVKHNMKIAGQKGAVLLRERKTKKTVETLSFVTAALVSSNVAGLEHIVDGVVRSVVFSL